MTTAQALQGKEILAQNLKAYRIMFKMSQLEMAQRVHMSYRGYGKLERQEVAACLDTIDKVADYKNKTNSIGFSFRYYMEGIIKNPNVKMLKIDGIEPNVENIKNEFSCQNVIYSPEEYNLDKIKQFKEKCENEEFDTTFLRIGDGMAISLKK